MHNIAQHSANTIKLRRSLVFLISSQGPFSSYTSLPYFH